MSKRPDALPPLRTVIAAHGLSARKALGQNFLLDEQLLQRIAAIAPIGPGDLVYEIGPGPGGLTRALLRTGADVIAIERDARCLPIMAMLAQHFDGRLRTLEADALQVDLDAEAAGAGGHGGAARDYHIVANLPYNIGTQLLIGWLGTVAWPPRWQSLTLMFQREVADRLVARVGDDAYGRLSVMAQWRCTCRLAMKVHRSAFTPPPKVMSAIVQIIPAAMPAGVDPAVLEALTAAAFGQRRKMLRQSLKAVPHALDALASLGIGADRRAETLSVDDYVALAQSVTAARA